MFPSLMLNEKGSFNRIEANSLVESIFVFGNMCQTTPSLLNISECKTLVDLSSVYPIEVLDGNSEWYVEVFVEKLSKSSV